MGARRPSGDAHAPSVPGLHRRSGPPGRRTHDLADRARRIRPAPGVALRAGDRRLRCHPGHPGGLAGRHRTVHCGRCRTGRARQPSCVRRRPPEGSLASRRPREIGRYACAAAGNSSNGCLPRVRAHRKPARLLRRSAKRAWRSAFDRPLRCPSVERWWVSCEIERGRGLRSRRGGSDLSASTSSSAGTQTPTTMAPPTRSTALISTAEALGPGPRKLLANWLG